MHDDLLEACRRNDLERAQTLVAADPTMLTRQDPSGETPLLAALYRGHLGLVDWLATVPWQRTLYEAAAVDDAERVDALLAETPDSVDTHSADGWTPLHLAAFFGADHAAETLLSRGADMRRLSRNPMANTPLHAALAAKRLPLVIRLLAAGADPALACAGYTPLAIAEQGEFAAGASLIRQALASGASA